MPPATFPLRFTIYVLAPVTFHVSPFTFYFITSRLCHGSHRKKPRQNAACHGVTAKIPARHTAGGELSHPIRIPVRSPSVQAGRLHNPNRPIKCAPGRLYA